MPRRDHPAHDREGLHMCDRSPVNDSAKHPMQPVIIVDGCSRFRPNRIVQFIQKVGGCDLNRLSTLVQNGVFLGEDYAQLMQLMGYSVEGFGELSTTPLSMYDVARRRADLIMNGEEKITQSGKPPTEISIGTEMGSRPKVVLTLDDWALSGHRIELNRKSLQKQSWTQSTRSRSKQFTSHET